MDQQAGVPNVLAYKPVNCMGLWACKCMAQKAYRSAYKSVSASTCGTLSVYYREKYGHLEIDAEKGKKETRTAGMSHMTISQFLDRYQKDDIYMVQDVLDPMKGSRLLCMIHDVEPVCILLTYTS